MKIKARKVASRRARERWKEALEWWRKLRDKEREEEVRAPGLNAEVGTARQSERLKEVEAVQYAEVRTKKTKQERRRGAVAATWSTRVGLRLWWWMEKGDGWDARGPSSVTHGRSRRVDGDG